jgi:excisionase family DNA binding protein
VPYLLENSSPIAIEVGSPYPHPKQSRTRKPLPERRPDAWRVNDALLQLGISRATLYKMANNGEIRLARIGGRTLVPDSEITRLVDGVSRSA